MCNADKTAASAAANDDNARVHTAHVLSQYLFSLSMMCKEYGWHKTGLHLCVASDELKLMLDEHALTQERYQFRE